MGYPKPFSDLTEASITLGGDVYSTSHGDTTYQFFYGLDATYGSETQPRTITIDDQARHPVSEWVSGLSPDSTYHYKMCVRDTEETPPRVNCSPDHIFATVGDYVRGIATYYSPGPGSHAQGRVYFYAASGTTGQNPGQFVVFAPNDGESNTHQVRCLHVSGRTATIGLEDLFMFVEAPADPGGDGTFIVEPLDSRAPSDCSSTPADSSTRFILRPGGLDGVEPYSIHDVP